MSALETAVPTNRRTFRTVELVLAHAHLRMGALALARVELETLAGLGALDQTGLVDLAEVRWRTGDLPGAGEMAGTALRTEEVDAVALVVASEAASALGRPSEARRLATLAIARAPDSIDAIFAGMPRSGVWPADGADPAPTAPTLFERGPENMESAPDIAPPTNETSPGGAGPALAAVSMTPGFWDSDGASDIDSGAQLDPAQAFEAGRVALAAGTLDEAALRFGLALRFAPALALAALDATEGERAPGLMMVRGDAYRLAGHEEEARRAYLAAAVGGLPERRGRVRPKLKAKPFVIDDDEPVDALPSSDEPGVEDRPLNGSVADDAATETGDAASA